VAERLKAAAC